MTTGEFRSNKNRSKIGTDEAGNCKGDLKKGCGIMKKYITLIFVCIFLTMTVSVSAQDVDKSKSPPPTDSAVAPLSLSTMLSQTVIFLYEDKTLPNSAKLSPGKILGTAFIVGVPDPGEPEKSIPFIITAKHVIANRSKILVRYSMKVGEPAFIQYDLEALRKSNDLWEDPKDEGVDIIVFRTLSYENTKMLMFPIDTIATKEIYKSENINTADRVVIPCLLANNPGTTQNYPIFRDGSIALITEEPIDFSWHLGNKLITTKQRIIFVNSILNEGFSGAPVFLWPGLRLNREGKNTIGGKPWLLGVVHGFQPLPRKLVDAEGEEVILTKPSKETPVLGQPLPLPRNVAVFSLENPATGMIFPSWKILDILTSDGVTKKVKEISEEVKKAKFKENKN
jgi:hypothetical protein